MPGDLPISFLTALTQETNCSPCRRHCL